MARKKTENPNLVSVSVKRSTLDDKGLENLVSIVRSKESLIQKAFATGPLRIEATKDRITFHWFVKTAANSRVSACEAAEKVPIFRFRIQKSRVPI